MGNSNMEYGSWDNNYKCSELDGGVQICIKNMKKNVPDFSSKTSQSNWSNNKKKKIIITCVCLGVMVII